MILLFIVFGVVMLLRVKLLVSIGGFIFEMEIKEMSVFCFRKEEVEKNCEGLKFFYFL